ncbi:MAG: diguanylate cyclase [Polyangiales bacterium]
MHMTIGLQASGNIDVGKALKHPAVEVDVVPGYTAMRSPVRDTPCSAYTILFVDDEPLMGRALRRTLKPHGITVEFATSAAEALELGEERFFPVVITDLLMPGVGGHHFIERFRVKHPESVFLILTGAPNPDMGSDEAAILRVLAKPWDDDELVETVRSAMDIFSEKKLKATDSERPCSVLLVEDDLADAALAKSILHASGHFEINHLSSVTAAVDYLHDRTVDVILTDLSLPDARGFDSIVRLQRACPSVPLLALSGMADESVALHAVRLGAQDFFTKGEQARHGLPRGVRLAVERKRAELRLREHANYDALTALANRAHFERTVSKSLARAKRSGNSCVVGMLDLDGFKAINDTYGHAAGDEVLTRVAARLGNAVREYDMVARLGGDEFIFLLDDLQSPAAAMPIVRRMLKEVALPIQVASGVEVQPGASFGVSAYPAAGRTLSDLRRVADSALYQAKGAGKNCIVFDPTSFALQREERDGERTRRDSGIVLHPPVPEENVLEMELTRKDLPRLEATNEASADDSA